MTLLCTGEVGKGASKIELGKGDLGDPLFEGLTLGQKKWHFISKIEEPPLGGPGLASCPREEGSGKPDLPPEVQLFSKRTLSPNALFGGFNIPICSVIVMKKSEKLAHSVLPFHFHFLFSSISDFTNIRPQIFLGKPHTLV